MSLRLNMYGTLALALVLLISIGFLGCFFVHLCTDKKQAGFRR